MSDRSPMTSLALGGLIHIWGPAGSGKTLLAVALASDVSKNARVEWVCTDGKKSFVSYLKNNVDASGGSPENVSITMINNQSELVKLIRNLPESDLPSLLVIDPITRVLDLGRKNPTMWGRELVEDVLPTLAGLATANDIAVIITSESRMLEDSDNHAVHHSTIAKWIDHDLCLNRELSGSRTHIVRKIEDSDQETAQLIVDQSGILEIIPRIYHTQVSEEV
ncbi:MAG: AAA family ATPase [Candidatus Thorarchaeota archaeon]